MRVQHPKRAGVAVGKWLSSWLAEQEVRVSIPCLANTVSEIRYLLLPSRDVAEISLFIAVQILKTTNQPT